MNLNMLFGCIVALTARASPSETTIGYMPATHETITIKWAYAWHGRDRFVEHPSASDARFKIYRISFTSTCHFEKLPFQAQSSWTMISGGYQRDMNSSFYDCLSKRNHPRRRFPWP